MNAAQVQGQINSMRAAVERRGSFMHPIEDRNMRAMMKRGEVRTYHIAHVIGTDGAWDIIETFEAVHDAAANAYAEQNYANDPDWYVLNDRHENING